MANVAETMELEQAKAVEPQLVSLRTQLVKQSHSRILLAETEHMTLRVHCYAPDIGENAIHAHLDEDHIFVVLQGTAQFTGLNGPLPPLTKNKAIVLPKGCFYGFRNATDEPLVLLRIGAGHERVLSGTRIDPDGNRIGGRGKQKEFVEPVFIEGEFFE